MLAIILDLAVNGTKIPVSFGAFVPFVGGAFPRTTPFFLSPSATPHLCVVTASSFFLHSRLMFFPLGSLRGPWQSAGPCSQKCWRARVSPSPRSLRISYYTLRSLVPIIGLGPQSSLSTTSIELSLYRWPNKPERWPLEAHLLNYQHSKDVSTASETRTYSR